jgi:hypothetical protein
MHSFDRQIATAAQELDAFAYAGSAGSEVSTLQAAADSMLALLVARADALMGCTEGSPEEAELAALTDAIEAYEAHRWPDGKVAGVRSPRGVRARRERFTPRRPDRVITFRLRKDEDGDARPDC